MRQFIVSVVLVLVARSAAAHGHRAFVNGNWFDGTQFVRKTMYSVDGVFRESFDGKLDETVDLHDGWVIPPFAEGHTHDFTTSDPAAVWRYLAAGIFYAKNDNSIARLVDAVRPTVNTAESVDVIWALGGITSSGGHPVQIYDAVARRLGWDPAAMNGEAYWIVDSKADLERQWSAILVRKPDFIKVYLDHSEEYRQRKEKPEYFGKRGIDPALLPAIVKRAHDAGLRVTVHVTSAADYRTAVAARVDEIAHLPLEALTSDDAKRAAQSGVWTVTTTLSHRPTEGVGDVDALHRRNLALLRDAGARVAFGTDGSHLVVDEIENVRRLGIFDDLTLMRIATEATPQLIFPQRKVGRLADGFEASFLVLHNNPLAGFSAIHDITMRVKTGHLLAPPKQRIVERLTSIAAARGAQAAIDEYRRMRTDEPKKWDLSEQQVNATGYALLQQKKIDEAIGIFAFNVELFPDSANVYDSLAEAYAARGDNDRAIENYRRSLARNPRNDNARKEIEMLSKAKPATK